MFQRSEDIFIPYNINYYPESIPDNKANIELKPKWIKKV